MKNIYPRKNNKIIAIVGPNASGKSEFAVEIAKKWGGEIISADSRQVYKWLNIGSGKVEGKWKKISNFKFLISKQILNPKSKVINKSQIKNQRLQTKTKKYFVYKNIIHHCIDFVSPKKVFSAAEFKRCAEKSIEDIRKRGKIPIICGGTGFYIDAALSNIEIPEIPPNFKLREKLEKKSCEELFKTLQNFVGRATSDILINRFKNIDSKNKRRLIRAIEIATFTGGPTSCNHRGETSVIQTSKLGGATDKLNILYLGINHSPEILKKRIEKRLKDRLRKGMIKEVKNLHLKHKLSWKRLDDLGLEYRYISYYLLGKIKDIELAEKIKTENWHYAKKQMTWFKRNPEGSRSDGTYGAGKKINWIDLSEKSRKTAEKLIKKFII